jgi:hypothetical protein
LTFEVFTFAREFDEALFNRSLPGRSIRERRSA